MKFLDKFTQYPNSSYIIDREYIAAAMGFISVEEVVERFTRYANEEVPELLEGYHIIDVMNPNADGIIPELPQGTTYRELKDFLEPHIPRRTLITKPDFSELCMEIYRINNPLNSERKRWGHSFCFDYGIIYGDYQLPEVKKLYKSDCSTIIRDIYSLFGYDLVLIKAAPLNPPDSAVTELADPHIALACASVIYLNRYSWDKYGNDYEHSELFIPIASISEFNPKKDFAVENLRKDVTVY